MLKFGNCQALKLHDQHKPGTEVSPLIFNTKSPDDLLRQYSELF